MGSGFILGDSAYPLRNYLLVPYRDNGFLTPMQKRFNFIHSSTRVCIEQAFGRLKGKFRILKYVDIKQLMHLKYIVIGCVVLHNVIIQKEGLNNNESELTPNENYEIQSENNSDAENTNNEARRKRDEIAMLFCA